MEFIEIAKKYIQPGEMYAAAVSALPAEDIDHHNSDLYLKRTPASQALIARLANRSLLTTFRDSDGVVWYELPFCFTPYWADPYKYT